MLTMTAQPKLKKVVFVDDDAYTNEYHKELADQFNLAKDVSVFNSAVEALNVLQGIDDKYDFPELILVDINMPNMDGHQFSAALQNMAGYNENRTCLAFLTSSKDIRDVIKADENSVGHYFWKPLNEKLLREILKDGLDIVVPE